MNARPALRIEIENASGDSIDWDVPGLPCIIGRSRECDLVLDDERYDMVSARHVRIESIGMQYLISDLNSSNGIYLNGERIRDQRLLGLGEPFRLGQTGPTCRLVDVRSRQPQAVATAAAPPPAAAAPAARRLPAPFTAPDAGSPPADLAEPGLPVAAAPPPAGGSAARGVSPTRELVLSQGRRLRLLTAVAAVAVAVALIVLAWPRRDDFAGIYRPALRSVVWFDLVDGEGSGVLIDRERRWVLTNHHVITSQAGDILDPVTVYFPSFDTVGRLITERDEYRRNHARLGIRGRVVHVDADRDLAVVEVERLPDHVRPMPLAASGPRPAQRVYTLGNPGLSDSLWVFTSGDVTAVYRVDEPVEAHIVQTNHSINPGDSGGPVLDGSGRLVALVSAARVSTNVRDLLHGIRPINFCIDVTDIHNFVRAAHQQPRNVSGGQRPIPGPVGHGSRRT